MEGFDQIMANHSDEKLIEILSNRDKYQEIAVNAAMKEAISREIIEGKADLEAKFPVATAMASNVNFNYASDNYYQTQEYLDKYDTAKKKKANNDMIYGAMWCIGGIILTVANTGFIFWGAILFGGIQFFRGLANSQ